MFSFPFPIFLFRSFTFCMLDATTVALFFTLRGMDFNVTMCVRVHCRAMSAAAASSYYLIYFTFFTLYVCVFGCFLYCFEAQNIKLGHSIVFMCVFKCVRICEYLCARFWLSDYLCFLYHWTVMHFKLKFMNNMLTMFLYILIWTHKNARAVQACISHWHNQ